MNANREQLPADSARLLRRIRWLLAFFIFGLVISGLTAFPLLSELNWLCSLLGLGPETPPGGHDGLARWLLLIRQALMDNDSVYPFLAYGTDWLAFAHVVIAFFFVAPLRDPVRNIAVFRAGMAACVAVIPLAVICGAFRGIPIYWRLIDCSFGIFGIIPLWLAYRWTKQLGARVTGRQ